jgi:hypothetical protein
MRPGKLEPNEFEIAVLNSFAQQDPRLTCHIAKLHVLSREFTGVGSFTRFQYEGTEPERYLVLEAQVHLPQPENGLGAVLFCRGDHPICLELYTFGDEDWDGVYEGYSITQTPNQTMQPTAGRRTASLSDD